MELGLVAAHTDIRVDAAHLGRGTIAPATIVDHVSRSIERNIVLLGAVLRADAAPSKRAKDGLDLTSFVVEAVLHLDRHGPADRVEAEDRVAGKDVEAPDRALRDEIPVHRIAERLVDAYAVLIDGQTLRRAHRGRREK